jgi:hypothetical protein
MPDRRYTDEEVAAIFSAAAEPQTPPPTLAREGLTLADLQDIGREVGISPEAVAHAARSLDLRGQAATRTFLGLPIGVGHTVALNRWVTDDEWERLVVELREVFQAKGKVRSSGSLREWSNGNLHVLLEPDEAGHRLRMRTLKSDARAYMTAGLATVGVSAAVAVASALGGQAGHAVSGIAFLALAGIGMFAGGALRVPSWARLRAQQMESIASRLTLPPSPSTPSSSSQE